MFKNIYSKLLSNVPNWDKYSENDIKIDTLNGGLSNELYIAQIKEDHQIQKKDKGNGKVLIRLFGGLSSDLNGTILNRTKENNIYQLLSSEKISPKLYYSFNEGRLEEYIDGVHLTLKEMKSLNIISKIVANIIKLHNIKLSSSLFIDQTPILFSHFQTFIDILSSRVDANNIKRRISLDNCPSLPVIKSEIKFLYSKMKNDKIIKYCHNDLQRGNILAVRKNDQLMLRIIDFEYSGWNYAAYDLGNYFCECYIDNFYKNEFKIDLKEYPSLDFQKSMVKSYFERSGIDLKNMNSFMKSIQYSMLCSHLFWSIWALVQENDSCINWCYRKYAKARFVEYFRLKCLLSE